MFLNGLYPRALVLLETDCRHHPSGPKIHPDLRIDNEPIVGDISRPIHGMIQELRVKPILSRQ